MLTLKWRGVRGNFLMTLFNDPKKGLMGSIDFKEIRRAELEATEKAQEVKNENNDK